MLSRFLAMVANSEGGQYPLKIMNKEHRMMNVEVKRLQDWKKISSWS